VSNLETSRRAAVGRPDAAVVVSSHDRPVRLRWLLNALAQQTLPLERFEVVVAHDSSAPDTERLLRTHPLRAAGRLRHLRFDPGSVWPGAKRNAAWRAARAPLVLFTDDDCRPAPDWLEQAVAAGASHRGAILQGRTEPDPDEIAVLHGAPWAHTVSVHPPTAWAETCNIAYPRDLLERLEGFDEHVLVGEDTDLAMRAQAAGAPLVAVPTMLVHHAVQASWLPARLRSLGRWQHMPWVVKRHPQLRREVWGRIWWKREHAALMAAAAAPALARRRPGAAAALALPWLGLALRHRGYGARGILRSVSELPGRAAMDATEIAALARGSLRYRTVLL
jgi:GT2 family glycosyltransferase